MAFESTLDEIFKSETIDANKILHELLSEKGLDMKTHISDPITFAILESTVNQIEQLLSSVEKLKLPLTKKFLKDLIKQLKKFLVSWNRLSRTEVKEILQANKEQESGARSFFQKLVGIGK